MATADKATAVADIAEQFKASTATVVTEYRGLTVANLAELRRSLGASTTYTVAKNTLVKRAASEAGIEGLLELLHELRELQQGHFLERVEQFFGGQLGHVNGPSLLLLWWLWGFG